MSGIDYSLLTFSKGTPRVIEKQQRRVARDTALRDCYAAVDTRDGGTCWASGRMTTPGAPDARARREHHHLDARSLEPGRRADEHNVITLCKEAHDLIKPGFLIVEGTDARKPIRFHWRADFTKPPFRIKSRRRSQQDAGRGPSRRRTA